MSDKRKDNPDEPTLSRGMKRFIVVGTVILLVALVAQLTLGDGFGSATSYDPDTTLLERKAPPPPAVDTARVDTATVDSTQLKPKKHSHKTEEESTAADPTEEQPTEEVTLDKMGQEEGKTVQPKPSPSVPKTPKPHIEVLEN